MSEGWAAPGRGLGRREFHYFRESALMSLCGRQVSLGTIQRLDVAADLVECDTCREAHNREAKRKVKTFTGLPSPRVKVGAW